MESEETVLEMLASYLVKTTGVSPEQLADPALKLDDLGLDSLGIAELLFEVEDRFGISFGDSADLKAMTSMTLNEAAAFFKQLIATSKTGKATGDEVTLPPTGSQHAVA